MEKNYIPLFLDALLFCTEVTVQRNQLESMEELEEGEHKIQV